MIPSTLTTVNVTVKTYPSKTYHINYDNNHIEGFIDSKEAMVQAVELILNTDRNKYGIYSSNYGSDIKKVIGKDIEYAKVLLLRYITNALMVDDRITNISNYTATVQGRKLIASFTVNTTLGNIYTTTGVNLA